MSLSEPLHIAFCANDPYMPYAFVAIKSIIENHKRQNVCIHIFTDFVSDRHRKVIDRLSAPDGIEIIIHIVDDTPLRALQQRQYTVYAWYRILIPGILKDVHRVLYLDVDTLVVGNLSSLFGMDMTGRSIAAVIDDWGYTQLADNRQRCEMSADTDYICSGVILMNLDYWRQHDISGRVIRWVSAHHDTVLYPDQDAINHVCQDSMMLLPFTYGVTQSVFEVAKEGHPAYPELYDCLYHPVIVHYSRMGPWYRECQHPHTYLWHQYNRLLGRSRARLKLRYKHSLLLKLKTLLWYRTHPNVYRNLYDKACTGLQR